MEEALEKQLNSLQAVLKGATIDLTKVKEENEVKEEGEGEVE